MSSLDEKLERQATHEGRAQRRLSTLEDAWRYRVEEGTAKRPTLVSICLMDIRSWWRRVEGDTDTKNPMFEQTREEKESRDDDRID